MIKNGFSEEGAGKNIHLCIRAFFDGFVPDWICLPDNIEAERQAQLFHQLTPEWPPNGVAAGDGTYVWVHTKDPFYWCRKQFPALNCFMLVGADMRCFWCTSDAHGSWHDMHVLRETELWRMLIQDNWMCINCFPGGIFFMDSAYETFRDFMVR